MSRDFSKSSVYIFYVEEILWPLGCIYLEIAKYLFHTAAYLYFVQ